MKTSIWAMTSWAVLSIATPSQASEAQTNVSELVVVATRTPQPLDRLGQQVTVIDAATLKARQVVVISDLLAQTPGVTVSRTGGVGSATSVRLRGAETDQTAVVIDGVKLNDPSAVGGGYNFANLLAGDIARIEVLRGGQSTLWGSGAIGGVINIESAVPVSAFEGSASLEGGSMGTGYGRVGLGGKQGRLVWRLAAGSYATDGVSAYRLGHETDGYRSSALSGRAELALTGDIVLDLRGSWSRGRNKFDGFPAPAYVFADDPEYAVTKTALGYAGIRFSLLDGRVKNRIGYALTDTTSDSYDPSQAVTPLTFHSKGVNRRWEYQGTVVLPRDWQATFGLESERWSSKTASPDPFDPNPIPSQAHVGINSVYAQAIGEVAPNLTLTLGVRHDSHDTFGDHTLGQIAGAWKLNEGATVLRASFGQGFKAPTLYQLYSVYGEKNLRPEAADSWDVGVEHHLGDGATAISATWFQRQTKDQIDFVSCAFGSTLAICRPGGVGRFGYYSNISRATAHGLELTGATRLGGLDLAANYTWTDAKNAGRGDRNRGKFLARRPEHQANLTASYDWPVGLTSSLTLHFVGESFDDAANTVRLKAYILTDLRLSCRVNDAIEVYGRVENALDQSYQMVRNYGAPGRGAYLGVRTRF